MKKAICLDSLPGGMSILERFTLARDAGFTAVEPVAPANDQTLDEIKSAAERTGVAVASVMDIACWSCPFSSPDAAEVERGLEAARRAIDCAAALNAGAVLIVPAVVNEAVTYEDAYERSQRQIRELIPLAAVRKIVLALENVWNKFLLSPMEFARYIDELASPWVKAYFDVGNILLYGFPQHWIKTLGPRIARIHLKDFQIGPKAFADLLEGDVNWPAVIAALRAIGYDGCLTAEVGVAAEDPVAGVHKVSKALDQILAM
ncbi:MAG: sugar phosphate isomerase/epimerase family protein [Planctomycetaceae bacterium]|nr:sugar phosphate isomerase/epimerase [Planctomycetaceae bacterium]